MAESIHPLFWLTFVKSLIIFTLVSLGVAVILLATNDWFGASDLISFTIWTILFSVPFSAVVSLFAKWSIEWSKMVRYIFASFLGLLIGYLLTILLSIILGPWFAAFSFPVFYCWLLGAVFSFLLSIAAPGWKSRIGAFILALIISIGFIGSLQQLTPRRLPDFVIVIAKDATREEIRYIWEEGIATTTEKGSDLLDGISGASSVPFRGQRAIRISFWPGTDEERRDAIKKKLLQISVVVDVVDLE